MLLDQSERSKWSRKQAQNLILHIFLIIIIIIRCSGMFRDGSSSGFYRRPSCGEFSPTKRSMELCMVLRDSSSLVSLFLFVTSAWNFILRTFPRYIFQDGGVGTSTSYGGRSFIHCFVERVERLCMFIHSGRARDKVLYCFVWNYREPGNMYLLETAMIFVCPCFAGLGIIRILSRCWRKNAKIFVKMDTECWKILVK